MKRTFIKNLFRDIRKTLSRYLSIVIIIAVGVAFYAGVRATSPDMNMSGDKYFKENNLMDFKIISTLGLTKDDISEFEKLEGVREVEGSYSIDAIVKRDDHELVLNINSLQSEKGINQLRILEGRIPENSNEAVVEGRFLKENNYRLGDTIVLKSGNDKKLEDSLQSSEFTIVGTADSPLYISLQRQLSSIGNGSVRGFVYILPQAFKSEVYTEAYIKTDNMESGSSLLNNKKYEGATENLKKSLENIGPIRGEIRYTDILESANNKIKEAEEELKSSRQKAEDEFKKGREELEAAKDKIIKAKEELAQNENTFNKKMEESKSQIENGKDELKSTENSLNAKALEVDKGKKALMEAKALLDQSAAGEISSGSDKLAKEERQLLDAEAQIAAGRAVIEENRKKLANSENQLEKARQEGLSKLSDGKKEIENGEKEVINNEAKLNSEEEKANKELADAEVEIAKNRDKLKDIKKPEWYVLGRSSNVGYETFRQDSNGIDNIGKLFPLIFFLVAALVSLTTMTRMVQENRMEIGTFKALGYSRFSITMHYLIYSLSASLMGSLIGLSFGFRLFPSLIINAYCTLYTLPEILTVFNSGIAIKASIIAVLFTTFAAVAATLDELKEVPASLLRPKAPKSGKRIFLERLTFIWQRFSFTKKVTARNIFRYKQRFFMTVIGIAACTGLLVTGFGLKGAILGAADRQFSNIYKYDMTANLTKEINNDGKNEMLEKLLKDKNIKSILFAYNESGSVSVENTLSEDAHIIVPEDREAINGYIDLNMKGKALVLNDEGVIITEKFSELINKKAGDTFEITVDDKAYKVKVSAVTEQYIQHYIYMSRNYYEELTGSKFSSNSFYGLLHDVGEDAEYITSQNLKNISGIGSVSFKRNSKFDFNNTIDSINSVVLVLIVSAGILAFVVIYNLTNININERRRELATIKLLGFYNKELAAYIYRENVILTIIGGILGILIGVFLNRFVVSTAETNIMMFLKTIKPVYFLYSIILTIIFSAIVNLAMYARFDKIDMIESLKSAE